MSQATLFQEKGLFYELLFGGSKMMFSGRFEMQIKLIKKADLTTVLMNIRSF